jgi:hypothetical protein
MLRGGARRGRGRSDSRASLRACRGAGRDDLASAGAELKEVHAEVHALRRVNGGGSEAGSPGPRNEQDGSTPLTTWRIRSSLGLRTSPRVSTQSWSQRPSSPTRRGSVSLMNAWLQPSTFCMASRLSSLGLLLRLGGESVRSAIFDRDRAEQFTPDQLGLLGRKRASRTRSRENPGGRIRHCYIADRDPELVAERFISRGVEM